MTLSKYKLILFILLLLNSCNQTESSKSKLVSYLNKLGVDNIKDVEFVVIAPLENGCHGCSEKTMAFAKNNYNSPQIKFVFVGNQKRTIEYILRGFFGEEYINTEFLVDPTETAVKTGLVSVFPVVYYLENGSKKNKKELTAENIENSFITIASSLQKQ